MSFTTRVAAAALALLTFSTPAMADNSFSAHEALVGTISNIGVDVYLNPSQVCDGIINGAYISGQSALVVCQDNATPGGGQAEWTENDLDTLRHEAQHLIQDCIAFPFSICIPITIVVFMAVVLVSCLGSINSREIIPITPLYYN